MSLRRYVGEGFVTKVTGICPAEILVRRNGGAAVAGLAWNAKGTLLAYATEDADAGMLEL